MRFTREPLPSPSLRPAPRIFPAVRRCDSPPGAECPRNVCGGRKTIRRSGFHLGAEGRSADHHLRATWWHDGDPRRAGAQRRRDEDGRRGILRRPPREHRTACGGNRTRHRIASRKKAVLRHRESTPQICGRQPPAGNRRRASARPRGVRRIPRHARKILRRRADALWPQPAH